MDEVWDMSETVDLREETAAGGPVGSDQDNALATEAVSVVEADTADAEISAENGGTPGEGSQEEAPKGAPYADPDAWEDLRALYPEADPDDPAVAAVASGQVQLTLRQVYEAVHFEELVAARATLAEGEARRATREDLGRQVDEAVKAAVETALTAAVEQAVCETEERLLAHIRARGCRPSENGTSGEGAIHMHPAVGRLTRHERAMLARRAENGETVHL